MLISSLALFKSSIAAFRFSLLRAMLFGIRNPVNKGMLVLSEKLVFWYYGRHTYCLPVRHGRS